MNEGSIQRELEHVFETINGIIYNEFTRLSTHEDRFALVLETFVQHFAHSYKFQCKDKLTDHSIKLRENGNRSFVGGQHYEALQKYTESIMYAANSSEALALAYANRSAVLFELNKNRDCIKDIDRALSLNYPDRLKTKLWKRKGRCLLVLEQAGADSAFQQALAWLEKTTLNRNERKKVECELKYLIKFTCPLLVIQQPRKAIELAQIRKPSPKILSASDAVTLQYSKKYGRHLVATRKIRPGEILINEPTYCMRLYHELIYTNCSYCSLVSWAMIPCDYCVNAAYCSEACRDKAWDKYHEVECPIMGALLCFKNNEPVFLALRMAIVATENGTKLDALRQELIIVDRNTDPLAKLCSNDGKLHSDHYRSLHCSQAIGNDRTPMSKLLSQAIFVAITVYILATGSHMFGRKLALDTVAENPDVKFIGGLMCKHLHFGARVKTHIIAVDTPSEFTVYGDSLVAVASLINHSCTPNTGKIQRTDSKFMHYAFHPIEKGEQIFVNYGREFQLMNRNMRRMHAFRWGFSCDCIACREDWPLMKNLPSYRQQSLNGQIREKLGKVMQKYQRNIYLLLKGTEENEPNPLNGLLEVIEALFTLARRPCKELILATTILKYFHAVDKARLGFEAKDYYRTKLQ